MFNETINNSDIVKFQNLIVSGCQLHNLDFDIQYSIFVHYWPRYQVKIRYSDLKILKKGKKRGINLEVKKDKPPPVIYHLFMGILLKVNSTYGTSKIKSFYS